MTTVKFRERYGINSPDVVAENFDGETVILNLANGHYFTLQGIAQRIWPLLLQGHTPESILASIGLARPDLSDGSAAFISRLVELNLVAPGSPASATENSPIDEGWLGENPQIDVYDDLAELIFADPIHDVDAQAGWPKKRTAP